MGVYDKIVNQVSNDLFGYWKINYNNKKHNIHFRQEYNLQDKKHRFLEFSLEGLLEISSNLKYTFEGETYPGNEEECSHIGIVFNVSNEDLPVKWSTISLDLKDIIRHEIEHLTQSGWNKRKGKDFEDESIARYLINEVKEIPYFNYFLLDKEVDAMLQGLYYKTKKQKKPFKEVIIEDLQRFKLTKKEKQQIINHWRNRIKALSLPNIL